MQVLSGIEGLLKKQAVALKHEEATTIRQVRGEEGLKLKRSRRRDHTI